MNIIISGDSDSSTHARRAIASFIQRSADMIGQPFFFVLRGNCKQGLLRHMGLSPRLYAALLMAANLVSFKGDQVRVRQDDLNGGFIDDPSYGLRGPTGRPNSEASGVVCL